MENCEGTERSYHRGTGKKFLGRKLQERTPRIETSEIAEFKGFGMTKEITSSMTDIPQNGEMLLQHIKQVISRVYRELQKLLTHTHTPQNTHSNYPVTKWAN